MSSEFALILGTFLGGFIGIVATVIREIFQSKRHRAEIRFKTALDYWKERSDTKFKLVEQRINLDSDESIEIDDIDWFLLKIHVLDKVLAKKDITDEDIERYESELNRLKEKGNKFGKVDVVIKKAKPESK